MGNSLNAYNKNGSAPLVSQTASVAEIVAAGLGVVWLVGSALYFLFWAPESDYGFAATLFVIFLPVALFWVAAFSARSSRIMQEEAERLHIAIDALRQTYVNDRQARGAETIQPNVEKKLDEIARAARKTETTLATFTTSRAATRAPLVAQPTVPVNEDQPSLALGTDVEDTLPSLSRTDLIRALNFPDTEQDEVGFAALRKALRNRNARQLVQASQDVLTLLSQDGIYMDDMRPDLARPEVWRRFANGERGRSVASLGGVRDRSSLALTAGRMREDTIFRDAAHHFLRRFDKTLVELEAEATDEELMALAETRTARAFMLLGRVTGAFD